MKTKIGIPFGLALVMFIGVFTTMLALGVMAPSGAMAQEEDAGVFEVTLSNYNPEGPGTWSFTVESDVAVTPQILADADAQPAVDAAEGTSVVIDFDNDANDPTITAADDNENWKLGGKAVQNAEVSGTEVTLMAGPEFKAIASGDDLSISYEGVGIVNSALPTGTTTLQQSIEVMVGAGAPMMSKEFTIDRTRLGNVSVTNSPSSPGAQAQYQIKFYTGEILNEGTSQILLEIDSSVGVPTSLSPQDVRISANDVTGPEPGETGSSSPNQSRPLDLAPTYQVLPGTDNRKLYTIPVPDMDAAEARNASIDAGATVTLTLLANSGFTNPTEAGTDDFTVSTSESMTGVKATFTTMVQLFSDDKADNRNKPLTVTGRGFKNGTTATVYLDKNKNGMKDSGDVDLIAVPVASDDTFEANFNVTVPPFDPLPLKNVINAVDGEVPPNTVKWVVPEPEGGAMEATDAAKLMAAQAAGAPIFEVEGLISVSPSTLGIGDTLTVSLEDWPMHAIATGTARLEIGDVDHTEFIRSVSGSGSSRQFEVQVQNDVQIGTQQVEITTCSEAFIGTSCSGASESDNTNLVISGADLIVRPTTVVPNQSLTVTGRGFTGGATINDSNDMSEVSFGGAAIKASGGPRHKSINSNQKVTLDNGGNWSTSIIVPVSNASVTSGPHILKVVDNQKRTGVAEVTIAERTLTLDPPVSRSGTIVAISGTGFPARNSASGAESVQVVHIEYPREDGTFQTVASVTPDSSGSFSTTFSVPLDAGIPSTNTVRAKFNYPGIGDKFARTSHEVPEGTITLDKTDVHPGDIVTVAGAGFKSFNTISLIEVGVAEVTPAPRPLTNATGEFTASFVVPGLEVGIKNVQVRVGSVETGTVASASLNILEAGDVAMMPEVMMAEAATPDVAFAAVIAEDNLIAVYHFDPATQNEAPNYGYSVYDARPLFMSGNNLDSIEPGQFYTVQVSEDQMGVTLGSQTVDLYAPFTPIRW